jgi:hypothetical protein
LEHRRKKEIEGEPGQLSLAGGNRQLRHTPIPQNFVALHGMGVWRYMNGCVAGLLIG